MQVAGDWGFIGYALNIPVLFYILLSNMTCMKIDIHTFYQRE